jgi:hypothetical protein
VGSRLLGRNPDRSENRRLTIPMQPRSTLDTDPRAEIGQPRRRSDEPAMAMPACAFTGSRRVGKMTSRCRPFSRAGRTWESCMSKRGDEVRANDGQSGLGRSGRPSSLPAVPVPRAQPPRFLRFGTTPGMCHRSPVGGCTAQVMSRRRGCSWQPIEDARPGDPSFDLGEHPNQPMQTIFALHGRQYRTGTPESGADRWEKHSHGCGPSADPPVWGLSSRNGCTAGINGFADLMGRVFGG